MTVKLFDLSLRRKLPLLVAAIILVTSFAMVAGYMVQTREALKKNMLARSEILGKSLIRTLDDAMDRDDVWTAYAQLKAPIRAEESMPAFQIEAMILADRDNRVFAASDPERFRITTPLAQAGDDFARLAGLLESNRGWTAHWEGRKILIGIPIMEDGLYQGALVLVHPPDYYHAALARIARNTVWVVLVLLTVLIPVGWYWGRRLAEPLTQLTLRMDELGRHRIPAAPLPAYPYGDEIGHLHTAYHEMVAQLTQKRAMEQEMLRSERLSALGRLASGIAHEINNPLGGLITALDTLRRHGAQDHVTLRVLPLLERGLGQIQEIVAALLVEARARSRALTPQDLEDVHTLLAQEGRKRHQTWTWRMELAGEAHLPATPVRQILINLLLNASRAAGEGGWVRAEAAAQEERLHIRVENGGEAIPAQIMEHLFEPFSPGDAAGHGLGLWVTWQIVQQLGGAIRAENADEGVRFEVDLPLKENVCQIVASV